MMPDINLNSNEEIKSTCKGYYAGKYFKNHKYVFILLLICCETRLHKTITIKLYYWAYNIQRYNLYDNIRTKESGQGGDVGESLLWPAGVKFVLILNSFKVRCIL